MFKCLNITFSHEKPLHKSIMFIFHSTKGLRKNILHEMNVIIQMHAKFLQYLVYTKYLKKSIYIYKKNCFKQQLK